jgi:GNAT superfamily N-acetyltransferase
MPKTLYQIPELPLSDEVLSQERFAPDDIAVLTYPTPNAALNRWFEAWTHEKTPKRDSELGIGKLGTLDWAFMQSDNFHVGGLYQLYLFLYKPTGELIACAGVVPEDRGTLKKYGLVGSGLWGYFNVDHRLRERGIGKVITSFVDGRVHAYAETHGIPLTFYLFTGSEPAIHLYEGLDWVSTGQKVSIDDFAGVEELPDDETLMRKFYLPGDDLAKTRVALSGFDFGTTETE